VKHRRRGRIPPITTDNIGGRAVVAARTKRTPARNEAADGTSDGACRDKLPIVPIPVQPRLIVPSPRTSRHQAAPIRGRKRRCPAGSRLGAGWPGPVSTPPIKSGAPAGVTAWVRQQRNSPPTPNPSWPTVSVGHPGTRSPAAAALGAANARSASLGRRDCRLAMIEKRWSVRAAVTPDKPPTDGADPGPEAPLPSWNSSWLRMVRPRLYAPDQVGGSGRGDGDARLRGRRSRIV